ncbi:thermonuclease family protein [Chloroflexota bacterium]
MNKRLLIFSFTILLSIMFSSCVSVTPEKEEITPSQEVPTTPSFAPKSATTPVSIRPTFSWNTVTNAIGYELALSEDPYFRLVDWVRNVKENTYTVTEDLSPSATYYWRVRAVYGNDVSDRGSWVTGLFKIDTTGFIPFLSLTIPSSSVYTSEDTVPQVKDEKSTIIAEIPIQPVEQQQNKVQVVRVIDGDTIEVAFQGYLYTIRYIGVDTPETVHPTIEEEPFGKEASAKNRELVEGRFVTLEKDVSETDKYGRLLRYVYVDDVLINAELVRLGYAQVSTYPPDVKYQDLFLQLQREAQEGGRGLWGLEEPGESPALPSTQNDTSNVQITLVFYDGIVPIKESDEYVEITNLGAEPTDIVDWVLKDISEGYPSFTFPLYTLQSGQSIRVYTNEIHPEYGGFSFGRSSAVWSNKEPDIAAIFNSQGEEVSRKSY